MFCNKCGSSITESNNFCGQCGEILRVTKNEINHSTAGDNGFSAGQYNNFTGNTINLGVKDEKPIAIIDRKYEKPVKFMGKHIKTAWLMVAGLVGFLANVATLFSSIGTPSNNSLLFGLLIGFSLFLLSVGLLLRRFRFVHLLFGTNVESDNSGYVYITKVGGDCPLCDGQLKLRNFGPKNKKQLLLCCTRNPEHRSPFDPTILKDL